MQKRNGHDDIKNPDARLNPSETLGAYLRDKRLSRNVSLEEVSEATGITSTVLQALENEEREQLPAEVYVKAFYKKYAEHLGIDPSEVQAKYQEHTQGFNNIGKKAHFNTVITLKGQEENHFPEILRRALLPLAIIISGVLLYWIYKNYLSAYNPLGFYREHYHSVYSFLFTRPSVFFC